MHQNFLNTESDDEYDCSLLYLEFIRKVSLPNFYESENEKSDIINDDFSQNAKKMQNNSYIDDKIPKIDESKEEYTEKNTFKPNNTIQIYQEENKENLLIPESFFIISDVYYSSFGKIRNEIILRLYRLPNYEANYIVHLKGRWCNLDIKSNDPILVVGSFEKKYHQSDNILSYNYEATIDNKNGIIILWPYFMISATRLSDSVHCLRRSVLISKVPWDTTQSDWTLSEGTIAHSLVENVLMRKIEDSNQVQQNVADLVNKNIIENGLQGITKNQMTSSLQPVADLANKLSTNLQNQDAAKKLEEDISLLFQQQKEAQLQLEAEKQKILSEIEIQKKMEIQSIIQQKEIENQRIEQEIKKVEIEKKKLEFLNNTNISYPPYGCEVVATEENMVSLQYGYVGICDLVLFDPKKQVYIPLEMKSGNSAKGQIWQSHQVQISTYILMMKESLKEKASDYGKIFYMKDNASVTIQQSLVETQSIEILRNSLVYKSMNQIVPPKIDNTKNCSKCQSLAVCELINDIEDIELGQYKPRPIISKKTKKSQKVNNFDRQDLQLQLLLLQQFENKNQYTQENSNVQLNDQLDDDFQEFMLINDDYDSDDFDNYNEELNTVTLPEYNQDQINFYKKMHKEIMDDIYEKAYKQYFNWMKTVDEREKEGIAINGLTLFYSKEIGSFLFISEKISKSKFRNYSKFVITKNGKQPILSTGVVCNAILNSDILIISLDKKLAEGESDLCIDLIKYINDNTPQMHNLTRLFVYSPNSLKRVTSMLIDHERSDYFSNSGENEFFFENLNEDQREAMRDSILSKNYTIISGCKSSGKTFLLSNLIQYLSTQPVSVLIIGPSESSVDYLCDLQKGIVLIIQVKGQDIITNSSESDQCGYFCATNISNFSDMFFFKKTFDILIVDDCEKIKMSELIGPINACSKFILCGDIYQARNDVLSVFSFIDFEKNHVNFLKTQYSKSQEIHLLENSIIYNYSTKRSYNSSIFKLDLNKLNEFHQIHQNWLIPVLSSATFFIDTEIENDHHYDECSIESVISSALAISLLVCGMKPESIGILCYDMKCKLLVKQFLKDLMDTSLKIGDSVNSVEVHHCSNYRDKINRNCESSKALIVCLGNTYSLSSYEASLSLLEAKERIYFIGREKIMKMNPFFKKILKKIDGYEKISHDVLVSHETPFNRISELI